MDRVAGAGLSEAKEAPGFRAAALQAWPPINPWMTEHSVRSTLGAIAGGDTDGCVTEIHLGPVQMRLTGHGKRCSPG